MERVAPLPSLKPDSDRPGQLYTDPTFGDVRLLYSYGFRLLELLLAVPMSSLGYHERLVVLVKGIALLKIILISDNR